MSQRYTSIFFLMRKNPVINTYFRALDFSAKVISGPTKKQANRFYTHV